MGLKQKRVFWVPILYFKKKSSNGVKSIMKIMVTGGAGFIGSNVVDGYLQAGHQVAVVDNLFTGKRENVNPEAKFYEMDIRSEEMEGVIESERPDVLNHHAAQISVPISVADPLLDADINIKGLLEATLVIGTAHRCGMPGWSSSQSQAVASCISTYPSALNGLSMQARLLLPSVGTSAVPPYSPTTVR